MDHPTMGSAATLSHGLHHISPNDTPPRIDGMGAGRFDGGWVSSFVYINLVN